MGANGARAETTPAEAGVELWVLWEGTVGVIMGTGSKDEVVTSPCSLHAESAMESVKGIVKNVQPSPKSDCALEIIKAAILRKEEFFFGRPSWLNLLLFNPGRKVLEFFWKDYFNLDKLEKPPAQP